MTIVFKSQPTPFVADLIVSASFAHKNVNSDEFTMILDTPWTCFRARVDRDSVLVPVGRRSVPWKKTGL
jgi:hypothetical protein